MTREEQRAITEFIERAVGRVGAVGLPPLDVEADAIIRALFVRNPEAAYRVTLLAMGQVREVERCRAEVAEGQLRRRRPWLARLFETRRLLRERHRGVAASRRAAE